MVLIQCTKHLKIDFFARSGKAAESVTLCEKNFAV